MPVVNLNNKTEVKPVINIPSTTVQQNVQAQTKTPSVTPAPVQTPTVTKTPGPTTPIASQTIQIPKVETKSA